MVAYSSCKWIAAARRALAAAVGVLLFTVVAASGQTNAEATITGVATDQSGAVLPGSPSRQPARASWSDRSRT